MRPSTSKAPTASLPPLPFRLLPGGANQFPGGSYTLKSSAFHGALSQQLPCPSTCGQSFRLSPELPLFHRQLVSNVIFVDVGTTPEACRYLAAAMGLT